MGDPACWRHVICEDCGAVAERLDDDSRCRSCRRANEARARDAAITRRVCDAHGVQSSQQGLSAPPNG